MAPHWDLMEIGQFWYDWSVNVIRRITKVTSYGFWADDGRIVWSWHKARKTDDQVVATWNLLT